MGGPCSPSVRFPKEKHGFVPCICENSENYRGVWTTRMAPWGGHVPQVDVFQRKSMALCHAFMKIVRITKGFGLPEWPHGGPCTPSGRFPKEKHGFVPCICENSENYRGIWTTRMAPWGGHVAQVHVFQRKSMVLCPPGTRIQGFVRKMDYPGGAAGQSYLE